MIFFTLWVSFAWGILFLFFTSVTQMFSANYGFNTFQTGLVQLAISIGAPISTIINPLQYWVYLQSAERNTERPGKPIPEARLYSAISRSLLFSSGLFIYRWSMQPDLHWIVPSIGIYLVGIGIYSIYLGVVEYASLWMLGLFLERHAGISFQLADAYEKCAASALPAASLGRNTFGAFLPLAS